MMAAEEEVKKPEGEKQTNEEEVDLSDAKDSVTNLQVTLNLDVLGKTNPERGWWL